MSENNKIISLITGAAGGLGRSLSRILIKTYPNHEWWLLGRTASKLNSFAEDLQTEYPDTTIKTIQADFTAKDWQNSVQNSIVEAGDFRLGILIHNAGLFSPKSLLEESKESIQNTFAANVDGPLRLTNLFQNHFGLSSYIFGVGSMGSYQGLSDAGLYATTKHALAGWLRSLRAEIHTSGVRVTLLMPGPIYTDSWQGSGVDGSQLIQPDDISQLVLTCTKLAPNTNVDEIVVNPLSFDR